MASIPLMLKIIIAEFGKIRAVGLVIFMLATSSFANLIFEWLGWQSFVGVIPTWGWILTAIIIILFLLFWKASEKVGALHDAAQSKLSVRLKKGEMLGEESMSSYGMVKVHRVVLKNEGLEPIKRGTLIYAKTHLSPESGIGVRIEPERKSVKQREDGNGIVPQKTEFQLNSGEEMEFDAFALTEFFVDESRRGTYPKLTYYGVAKGSGLRKRDCTLVDPKTYTIRFKATSDTGGPIDFTVDLKFIDPLKPIKVSEVKICHAVNI